MVVHGGLHVLGLVQLGIEVRGGRRGAGERVAATAADEFCVSNHEAGKEGDALSRPFRAVEDGGVRDNDLLLTHGTFDTISILH